MQKNVSSVYNSIHVYIFLFFFHASCHPYLKNCKTGNISLYNFSGSHGITLCPFSHPMGTHPPEYDSDPHVETAPRRPHKDPFHPVDDKDFLYRLSLCVECTCLPQEGFFQEVIA